MRFETSSRKLHFLLRTAVMASVIAFIVLPACSRPDRTSPRTREKITIACSTPPYTVLIDIARNRGYFEQEGLDVTPRTYAYGKLAFDSLLRGEADLATVGETPFMFAVMHGEKLSLLATIQTSNRNNAIIARKDKGIVVPEDLKGRKIGVTSGTIGEFFMDAFLVSHGIARKQVTVINLSPEMMQKALEDGDVDAVSIWSPFLNHVKKQLAGGGTVFYDPDIYTQNFCIAASRDYVGRNAGKISKVLRALVKAQEFAAQDTHEAMRILAAAAGMDMASIEEMWKDNAFVVTLDQSLILALEDESRWAVKAGLVKSTRIPNYLDSVYIDGLASVKPDAVRIIR